MPTINLGPCACCGSDPVANCEELCEVLEPGIKTIRFEGNGSCLDGAEVEVGTESSAPCAGRSGWVAIGSCNNSFFKGANVHLSFCGGHNPPCCTSVPGPGSVEVVHLQLVLTDENKVEHEPAGMVGCTAVTSGPPYSMTMCTGGIANWNVNACQCIAPNGLTARLLE